jgi:hypothetical protein
MAGVVMWKYLPGGEPGGKLTAFHTDEAINALIILEFYAVL